MPSAAHDSTELLQELIGDAKLVAAYGQRGGILPDAGLMTAIAAVEALDLPRWSSPEVAALQAKLNEAMRIVPPNALVSLKRGWSPFRETTLQRSLKLAVVAFSFLLMIVAASATFTYNNGSTILAQLEDLDREKPAETIGHIARQLTGVDGTVVGMDPGRDNGISREAYFALLDRWNVTDYRVHQYMMLSQEFVLQNNYWLKIKGYADGVLAWLGSSAQPARTVASLAPGATFATDSSAAAAPAAAVPPAALGLKASLCMQMDKTPQAAPSPASAGGTRDGAQALREMITETHLATLRIACTQSVQYLPGYVPYIEINIMEIRSILNIFGLWLLPALYGAFGATLFYLRSILNPMHPDPTLARVAHRVALGAFAGIILAWFWSPSAEIDKDLSGIGLDLFGAAFLVGFSLDVFFALLDRLVTTASGAIGKAPVVDVPRQPM